jgi:hypothetical protein
MAEWVWATVQPRYRFGYASTVVSAITVALLHGLTFDWSATRPATARSRVTSDARLRVRAHGSIALSGGSAAGIATRILTGLHTNDGT